MVRWGQPNQQIVILVIPKTEIDDLIDLYFPRYWFFIRRVDNSKVDMCLRKPPRQHTHRQVRKIQLPTSLVVPIWFFVLLRHLMRLNQVYTTNLWDWVVQRWQIQARVDWTCRSSVEYSWIVSGKWEHIANQIWDHLFADSNRELIIRVQNAQFCRENNSNSPKIDVAVTGSDAGSSTASSIRGPTRCYNHRMSITATDS